MKITCNHSASSYGFPVILNDNGDVMDYAPGIKLFRKKLGLTTIQLGQKCGVSGRTIENWEQGRMPSVAALNAMSLLIPKTRKELKGFTIVEMLAATALLSMIAIILFSALNTVTSITARGTAAAFQSQDTRMIVDQMSREIQQAIPYVASVAGVNNDIFRAFNTVNAQGKTEADLHFVAVLDNNTGHEEAAIHYVYDGTNTIRKCIDLYGRKFYPGEVTAWTFATDPLWINSPSYNPGDPDNYNYQPILEGVKSMTFEVWSKNSSPPATESAGLPPEYDEWPAGKAQEIPAYVRINIQSYPPDVIRRWGSADKVTGLQTNSLRYNSFLIHLPRSQE